jgi:outer membrane protein TolC
MPNFAEPEFRSLAEHGISQPVLLCCPELSERSPRLESLSPGHQLVFGASRFKVSLPAQVTPGPAIRLSLREAVDLAKRNNLSTRTARERENEARGLKLESASGLLPNLSGAISQASITANLASFGFTTSQFPGLTNSFLGPFRVFDARVRLIQNLIDMNAIRRYQSGRTGVVLSRLEEQLAEEQITSVAGLAYVETLRSQQAVEAAEADLELANSLLKLASDQHDAGIATGVDVTRAQTRVAQQEVVLAETQRRRDQARLQLLRISGLKLSSDVTLTDSLKFEPEPGGSVDAEVAVALQTRLEVQIASEQVRLNDYERKAAVAEQLPSLQFEGDYGVSGVTPAIVDLPTRSVVIRLNVPIFNGAATRGRIEATTSRQRQSELVLNDVRAQVEEDVRLARQSLAASADAVRAANQALILAQRELQMARDRFAAGVGDNLEVLNAQTATADARLSAVAALAQYNTARLNLAAALGRAQSFSL